MVRWLIQQQCLRMPKQSLRQQHAHFLSALQFPHLAAVQFVGNIQTLQQDRGIALSRITVLFPDNAFQLTELHAIGVCHVVLGINRVALLQRRPQTLVSHDDRIDHAVGVERELVLAQDPQLPRTHDRHFLNSICTHIADIDYETIIPYTGTYDDMVVAKTQGRSQIESQNAQREKKIAQLNEFIARFSAGTRSSQVQSRRKEVERLQVTELARSNIQRPYIKFEQKRPSGKHILELEGLRKSYADKEVIRTFTASVIRGERIALMGRNGAGKTTLLNALLANSPTTPEAELRKTSGYDGAFIDGGKVIWGHEASVGYFAQDHRTLIETGTTALEWLHQWDPSASNEELRGILGQMLFAREEATKSTNVLSGGEAARLLFCKLMLQKPNVLVFDEPTNHLDLESINALNIALQRFHGTVLLVTHDHDLIDEVATRIWHFERDHKITDFKGSYEDYQAAIVV